MKIKYLLPFILVIASCKKELEDKVSPKSNPPVTTSSQRSESGELIAKLIDYERVKNPGVAIEYSTKLIESSRINNDKEGEALGFYKRAYIQDQHLNEYGKSLSDYYEALKIYQELNMINEGSSCYLGMGGVYYKLGEFNKAISYYQKLLQNAEQANNKVDQAVAYRSIAICYRELNENVDHIILFFEKALEIREELHDEIGIADCYNGMAATYYDINKDYQYAKIYYLKALDILKGKDNHQLANVYFNLGLIHKELKEEKVALDYFGKSLRLAEKINYSRIHAQSREEMGMIYLNKKDYMGAIAELQEAEKIAKQANDNILLEEINQLLSVCYKETGDINKALGYAEETLKMKSINSNNELMATIKRNVQLVEVGKFESSLKKSPSSISWEWMVLGSVILITIISFLIWGIRSKREKELLAIIGEKDERIDDLKFTLMDTAKHMFDQSNELGDLKDRYNEIVDELNRRNGDEGWMNNLINSN